MLNWILERWRELLLWPVNLVRDFPVRAGRLLRLSVRGVRGAVWFLPELVHSRPLPPHLRHKLGRLTDWLHQLLAALFDLVGGPELTQFLLHLFAHTSPLTRREIAMMAHIVGLDGLRFQDVRVVEGGLFDLIFRLNGNLAFATWYSINLPRTGRHTRANLPLVIHELTHVYQYERVGSRYLGEAIYMLVKTKRDCYSYGGREGLARACTAGTRYSDYNREQQAMIAQNYCADRLRRADLTIYAPILAQLRDGDL